MISQKNENSFFMQFLKNVVIFDESSSETFFKKLKNENFENR